MLSLKELKRRRLARTLAKCGGALDSIRKACDEAQFKVTAALEEARVIYLSGSARQDLVLVPPAGAAASPRDYPRSSIDGILPAG